MPPSDALRVVFGWLVHSRKVLVFPITYHKGERAKSNSTSDKRRVEAANCYMNSPILF